MVVDGEVWVTCEFCNSRYRFDAETLVKPDDAD
jgi:redox-regulated HSP33 family molecular chaperone